ncbi:TnsA endonuclease N-terminal domain-containing protein [Piscinibacter gummiphilus]|uniref:TnsA endonuclease N-terminal domain-containing protein n=1 Tax=Piscinibacter gummiphilus TaxID=946333 RepID=A0ABZ0D2K3_9BURK|nr:TnsA endonuclease N-terminal domain-containing protein [Piscinibacter gummiphilus]WOB11401.1 TnsA endonuclease N-terminal domain-containing protein [Piscinibacter gummiphilus]
MKPARAIVTRSPHRNVGVVHAPHIQGAPIDWESFRERSFIRLALTCTAIAHIQHQPFQIHYVDAEGQTRKHTPDFLVTLRSGTRVVVEIKTTPYIPEHQEKFDRSAAQMRDKGGWYYVVTEKELNTEREERAEIWRRYARAPAPADQIERALQLVRENQGGQTGAQLSAAGVSLQTMYHLLGRRVLTVGRDLLLKDTTTLNFPEKEQDDRLQFDRWFGCAPWESDLSAGT